LIELRIGRPTFLSQFVCPPFSGGRLRKHAGRGAQFGRGLLCLQREVHFIEHSQWLADLDTRSNFDKPLGNLSSNAEAEVALDPRTDDAHEASVADLGLVADRGHQDGAPRGRWLGSHWVAGSEHKRRDKSQYFDKFGENGLMGH
jgi:hypothetical protein